MVQRAAFLRVRTSLLMSKTTLHSKNQQFNFFQKKKFGAKKSNFLAEAASNPVVGSSKKRRSGSLSISIPILNLLDSPPLIPLFTCFPTLLCCTSSKESAFSK